MSLTALDADDRWKRAMAAGPTGDVQAWNPGAHVFCWRKAKTSGDLRSRRSRLSERRRGPAVVPGQVRKEDYPDPAYWIAHGEYLLLLAAPHLRSATAEERLADRVMTRQLAEVQGLLGQDRSVLRYFGSYQSRAADEGGLSSRPFEHRGARSRRACSFSTSTCRT